MFILESIVSFKLMNSIKKDKLDQLKVKRNYAYLINRFFYRIYEIIIYILLVPNLRYLYMSEKSILI